MLQLSHKTDAKDAARSVPDRAVRFLMWFFKSGGFFEVLNGEAGYIACFQVLINGVGVDKEGVGIGNGAGRQLTAVDASDNVTDLIAGILHTAGQNHAAEGCLAVDGVLDQFAGLFVAVDAEDAHVGVVGDGRAESGEVVVDTEGKAVMRGEEDLDFWIGGEEVLCGGHAGVGVFVLELNFF